ncbi:MAG: ABC transporter substrate-binding protein [Candidatus Sericytochromatia bacterium]
MNSLSRIFSLLLVVALFPLAGCPDTGDGLKVAVAVPLTGARAQHGQSIVNGVMLAVEEFNQAGGIAGRAVSMSIRDDQGQLEQAKKIAGELLQERPAAVFVSLEPEISRVVVPLYTSEKIVVLSPSSPLLSDPVSANLTRQYLANPAQEAQDLVQFMIASGYRRLALVHEPGLYGQTLRKEVRRHLRFHGLEPVWENRTNSEPVTENLEALLAAGSEGIIYCGNYPLAAQWAEVLSNQKLKLRMAGPQDLFNREFVRQAGKGNVSNVVALYPRVDYPAEFWERYKRKFGDPSTRAILAYLSAKVLLQAYQAEETRSLPKILNRLSQSNSVAYLHSPQAQLPQDYLHLWQANQQGQFQELPVIPPQRWRKSGIRLGEFGRKVSPRQSN